MDNFEPSIAEILEVEEIKLEDEFESFESWDSLTRLSIIALCEAKYKVSLSGKEIEESKTILGLKELIEERLQEGF